MGTECVFHSSEAFKSTREFFTLQVTRLSTGGFMVTCEADAASTTMHLTDEAAHALADMLDRAFDSVPVQVEELDLEDVTVDQVAWA